MGKKKQKSESTQQMTYGYVPHQATADEGAYRNSVQNYDFHTPIVNAFGQAENDINDTTLEDALPDGVKERIKAGRLFDLRERKGMALSQAAGQEQQAKSAGLGSLAGMTQNPFVQTGGSATGSVTMNNPFLYDMSASAGSAIGGA